MPERGKKLRALGADALFLVATALVVYGLYLAWKPLGFVGGGVVIAIISLAVRGDED